MRYRYRQGSRVQYLKGQRLGDCISCCVSATSRVSLICANATTISNQIIFIGLRSSKDYYKRPEGGVGIWEGSLGCEFLLERMCAEGMGGGRRWVRWVLRGTGTASGHPGVPWKISPTMRWLSQPAVCSKMGMPEYHFLWHGIFFPIPYRSITLANALHLLQGSCLQSKTCAFYNKTVFCWTFHAGINRRS